MELPSQRRASVNDFAALVQDFERRQRDAERTQATAPVATILATVLEDLRSVQLPNGTAPRPTPDTLIKAKEVAERLGVCPRYVYAHRQQFPFTRELPGGSIRFSERGLTAWIARTP